MQKGGLGVPAFLGAAQMGMALFSVSLPPAPRVRAVLSPLDFQGEVPKSLLINAQPLLLSLTNSYTSFKAHSNVFSHNLTSELLKHLTLSCPVL